MGDLPQQGGWVKLWRSFLTNGHLANMPEQALKVFVFLLLKVNHAPAGGCQAGEGWITYEGIKQGCSDPYRPAWSDKTIAKALDYLEGKNPYNERYIKRIKTRNGAAQRIRIINWDKYQGETSFLGQEVGKEVWQEVRQEVWQEARQEVRKEKQEGIRMQKKDELVVVDDGKAAALQFLNSMCLNWQAKVDDYRELLSFGERISWPVVERAARNAIAGNKGLGYCLGTLRNWENAGVRTVEDAKVEEERFRNRQSAQRERPRSTAPQREIHPVDEFERKRRRLDGVQ